MGRIKYGVPLIRPVQIITCTPPPAGILFQKPESDKLLHLPESRGPADVGKRNVFPGRQTAFEPPSARVQHPVDHLALPFRKGLLGMGFPERGFIENGFQEAFRPLDGPAEAAQKPVQPLRDVSVALLASLEHIVIGIPFRHDLGGKAVIADRLPVVLGQGHIGQSAGNPAIAVFKGMDGHEPEMGDRRPEQTLQIASAFIPPCEEMIDLGGDEVGVGRLEVNGFAADGAGYNPHGLSPPPFSHRDFVHARIPCREKGGMPAQEAFLRKRGIMAPCRVQKHRYEAVDMVVCGKSSRGKSELSGHG